VKKILSAILISALFSGAINIAAAAESKKPSHNVKQKVFVHWQAENKGRKSPKPPKGPQRITLWLVGTCLPQVWIM
jgi:hypothetical protein